MCLTADSGRPAEAVGPPVVSAGCSEAIPAELVGALCAFTLFPTRTVRASGGGGGPGGGGGGRRWRWPTAARRHLRRPQVRRPQVRRVLHRQQACHRLDSHGHDRRHGQQISATAASMVRLPVSSLVFWCRVETMPSSGTGARVHGAVARLLLTRHAHARHCRRHFLGQDRCEPRVARPQRALVG